MKKEKIDDKKNLASNAAKTKNMLLKHLGWKLQRSALFANHINKHHINKLSLMAAMCCAYQLDTMHRIISLYCNIS
jgi:hypothetical protein